MEALRRFRAIVRADLLERSRAPRFWVVLGLIAAATWWCFPPASANYLTVSIGSGQRGIYSSAWIGMVLALEFCTLLSLAGFYLVRGTLVRDIDTRVWQLLVATPMTRAGFLLAKWCSHMVVFGLVVGVGLVTGLVAQYLRAEDRQLDLIELIKPVLVLALPSLAVTAMSAVWFDLVPWLRRTAGNVLYFVVWVTMLSVSLIWLEPKASHAVRDSWMSDPGGMVVVIRDIDREGVFLGGKGKKKDLGLSVGTRILHQPVVLFHWKQWRARPKDLLGRALWLALALGGVLLAAPLLDRAAAHAGSSAARRSAASGLRLRWLQGLLKPLQRGPVGTLLAAELQLVLRQRGRFWWLVLIVLGGIQLFGSINGAAIAMIASWLLSIDAHARAILRERETGTTDLVFSAAGATRKVLLARWMMLLLLAWLSTLPAMLRFALSAPDIAMTVLVVGASIATWGLALGAVCRNPRPFELLFCLLAYASVQGVPALNAAVAPTLTASWHLGLLPAGAAIVLALWPRMRRR